MFNFLPFKGSYNAVVSDLILPKLEFAQEFYGCPDYLQVLQSNNKRNKRLDEPILQVFPILSLWKLMAIGSTTRGMVCTIYMNKSENATPEFLPFI